MKRTFLLFLIQVFTLTVTLQAQRASLAGNVMDTEGNPLPAQILLEGEQRIGTVADEAGNYSLENIATGNYQLSVRMIGFATYQQKLFIAEGVSQTLNLELKEDVLGLEQIVVTATRGQLALQDAPIIVNQIDNRIFEATQALSLSEGLSFSPGLRLENNCQNCGFTQVRMNGLDGAYSQVLINSRPIFSALMGVYGLDFIPTNMIERVEVVRGAGSVLYGGNAIGGTINVITKDPTENSFEIGSNLSFINMKSLDRVFSTNASLVSEEGDSGFSFYAFNRNRQPLDYIGDGFSEITALQNTTIGIDAFLNTGERSKLKLNLFHINEFRRGGNGFDLEPHQTDLAEQLKHNIVGGGVSYELFSKNYRHKWSIYTSGQQTRRDSYYGGGGRVLAEGDDLTDDDIFALNAYGNTHDWSAVGGLQYNYDINKKMMLTLGSEYQHNETQDAMPGYGRLIEQQVNVVGNYAQLEWQPQDKWTFLLGGRYDFVNINGIYNLENESLTEKHILHVPVPRLSVMYKAAENLRFRFAAAQGYRAPQAFDEDFHIETVGGAALFTRLAPDLVAETSNSLTASLDYNRKIGKSELRLTAEGFYTHLNNPFITAAPISLPSGVAVLTKRNGEGATIAGTNVETRLILSKKWDFQAGFTLQQARYDTEEEVWSDEETGETTTTDRILRTPNLYGFMVANWKPLPKLDISLSSVYTASMEVPHITDTDTEFTEVKQTPDFFELNLKVAYDFKIKSSNTLKVFAGIQNMLNSFQSDFDRGVERDAGYVYGPLRPRTLFFGVKFAH